jgi:2-oxoglutarate dehydrogenase E2 component (dihydrolipoamide succinyltransferase)
LQFSSSKSSSVSVSGGDEIIEMDRMRKLIAGYGRFGTNISSRAIVHRSRCNEYCKMERKNKNTFEKREGEKLTYTYFHGSSCKSAERFPGMNISVDGDYIIKKKNINLGMAASLPNGNLIVPVIKMQIN